MKSWHKRSTREGTIISQEQFIGNCVGNCERNVKESEKWYEYVPEGVGENEEVKILWDGMIQCERQIKARKLDIVAEVERSGRE